MRLSSDNRRSAFGKPGSIDQVAYTYTYTQTIFQTASIPSHMKSDRLMGITLLFGTFAAHTLRTEIKSFFY